MVCGNFAVSSPSSPKSSRQNRGGDNPITGDSNCRELDVSIDNGREGSKSIRPGVEYRVSQ